MDSLQFFHAVYQDDLPTVTRFLAAGFDPNTRNQYGSIAIVIAAGRNNTTMVAALLSHGADPNLRF